MEELNLSFSVKVKREGQKSFAIVLRNLVVRRTGRDRYSLKREKREMRLRGKHV